MTASALEIEIARSARRVEIVVCGELDVSTVTTLKGAALDEIANAPDSGPLTLVLNLQRLSFLDSTGLGMLVAVRRRANESHVKLEVNFLRASRVEDLLRMTGLLRVFANP